MRRAIQLAVWGAIGLVWCATAASAATSADTQDGRWKDDGNGGCYWDANDSGPDQCSPGGGGGGGRYKWTADGYCHWEASESGPNQCDPNSSTLTELPPGMQVPALDENASPQQTLEEGLGFVSPPGEMPSCAAYTKLGNAGYIAVQTLPGTGTVAWGAYMYNPLDNYGWWWAIVYMNGVKVDEKKPPAQFYPPHGSITGPHGGILAVTLSHTYMHLEVSWSYNPWFESWIPNYVWSVRLARGILQCQIP